MASFVQTDTAPTCGDGAAITGCSGRSGTGSLTVDGISAAVGGSVGSSPISTSMGLSESNVCFSSIDYGPMPSGFDGVDAGEATININVTDDFTGTPSITEIHLCRFNSSCVNQETVASLTGQTTTINGVGVKTFVVTIGARVAFGATDRLVAIIVGTNASSMIIAAGGFTPDQTDTIPLYSLTSSATNLPLLGAG